MAFCQNKFHCLFLHDFIDTTSSILLSCIQQAVLRIIIKNHPRAFPPLPRQRESQGTMSARSGPLKISPVDLPGVRLYAFYRLVILSEGYYICLLFLSLLTFQYRHSLMSLTSSSNVEYNLFYYHPIDSLISFALKILRK